MHSEDGTAHVEDAELHVRRLGDGPPLLMISGGTGAADSYRVLAQRLAEEYTVLLYDRRGHFGSKDGGAGPIRVEQHAEDAHAVVRHFGFGKALVFGSSAGAQIGLALAAQHPETVEGLVAHEPPAVRLLPDAEEWQEFAAEQVGHAEAGDVLTAFTGFIGSIAGAGLPTIGAIKLPHEEEWRTLFSRELKAIYDYLPDVETLRRSLVPIVLAAGEGSRGYYHYRPARMLALELGLPFVELPGAHLAPQRNAAAFAEALSGLLTELVL
ncbi:alpha/beta hydrolase [Amycolatopsis bartoniae]|uniref:Alpha/beta hydrolase n=1 Tax=Amycolatopsis bartoniae TaxID=941986 RepID=A0A8H9J2D2_9PSEU|nr:alpha/beta hydrolase [Amycolatopsis bartoniae]TVT01399.1 alpha/beta hydrolase [Amycolatopsis bartoniae]GHF64586.1 alpha/beta hydrolase [Amycolatopsis bartoniae]